MMIHPSKCPGCKVLKSVHDIGLPGKNCPGPDLNEYDNASVVEPVDPTASNAAASQP